MRTTQRGNEQLVAARPGTGTVFRSLGWALTLARRRCLSGRRLFRLLPLTHPFSIPATLLATALAAAVRLSPGPTGSPRTPTVGGLLARRTAIPRLWAVGLEELLAALQQAAATPRPTTRALPPTRSSIMLKRTQGRANSRRSSLGEETLSSPGRLIPAALSLGHPLLQANWPRPRPPLRRPSAATDDRRPPPSLVGEMAQFLAAANTSRSDSTNGRRQSAAATRMFNSVLREGVQPLPANWSCCR